MARPAGVTEFKQGKGLLWLAIPKTALLYGWAANCLASVRGWICALLKPAENPNGTCARCGIAVPDDTNICDDCAAYWAIR